jgi:energy-coupling factor transporter ATP-binding protein EcfA2
LPETLIVRAYPEGSFYGDLLHWHLRENGTRPDGARKGWRPAKFAQLIYGNSDEDPDITRSLKNWMNKNEKKPPPLKIEHAVAIQRELFFCREKNEWNPSLTKWADDLWAARARQYGTRVKEQWYKEKLPFEEIEHDTNGGTDQFGSAQSNIKPLSESFVEREKQASESDFQAPPTSSFECLDGRLRPYVKNLIQKFEKLPLEGIRDSGGLEIELEKVYVALRAISADFAIRQRLHEAELLDRAGVPSLDAINADARNGFDEEVVRTTFRFDRGNINAMPLHSVGELFRQHRRLVILGAPGCGKSTLGRWIALQSARSVIEEFDTGTIGRVLVPREQVEFDPTAADAASDVVDLGPARIPIFLPVTHFARELAENADSKRPAKSLMWYLGRDPASNELEDQLSEDLRNACFQEIVKARRAIVILDGLDEMADSNRLEVVAKIHKFIDDHIAMDDSPPHEKGGNQIIITSRRVGYDLAPILKNSSHFLIEPMVPKAVERFAHSWCPSSEHLALIAA